MNNSQLSTINYKLSKDFTLPRYRQYLEAIKEKYGNVVLFREYMANPITSFCMIRHDVDRKPGNALKMAQLEKEMGIKASYYFRMKDSSFDENIIKAISELGHEIGYHYENLSDTNGDYKKAYQDFEQQLEKFRKITKIDTISMHGRPFSKFDNRDLWKSPEGKALLKKLNILGELYLDIDYSDVLYISDTGRNWQSDRANIRDKVSSNIKIDFNSGDELLNYLHGAPHPRLVFQIHPERWSSGSAEYMINLAKDSIINMGKKVVR